MRKAFKITGITLASIIGIILIAIGVAFWLVLTPARLTPIVKQQAEKYISCQTLLDQVDLTIFETFPNIGLKIKNLQLINPFPNAPNDTLASIGDCTITLDIKELIKNSAIIVNQFHLKNGFVNLFVDSLGIPNYDVFVLDTTEDDDSSSFSIDKIDLNKITVDNLRIQYTDIPSKIQTQTNDLHLIVNGQMQKENITGDVELTTGKTSFILNDSLPLIASLDGLETKFKGDVTDFNDIKGILQLSLSNTSFSMEDIPYVQSASLSLNSPLHLLLDKEYLQLDSANVTLNEHVINLRGNISHDADNGNIDMNIAFNTNYWDIQQTLKLLPYSITSTLNGMDIYGGIVLKGNAKGIYNDSLMPIINADILYSNGKFAMSDLPYKFYDVNANMNIAMNLNPNAQSKLNIHTLNAKTGSNFIKGSGTVNDLLGKMFCNLNINAQLNLPELQSSFPNEIKAKGYADASIHAQFTYDQLMDLALKQMKVSGSVDLTDLDVVYNDSMTLRTANALVHFELPSVSKKQEFPELVHAEIESKDLNASMIDFLSAKAQGIKLDVGVSDFMDTTKLISIACDFNLQSLHADMDTISVDITKPVGTLVMQPSLKNAQNPRIKCVYQNDNLLARMGNDFVFQSQKINIKGNASYDDKEQEIILQWSPDMNINLQQGSITIASFPTMINIPTIAFNFNPEKFDIKESRIKLGNSDFNLSGVVTNIDGYLKNDGLLKGDLEFVSENTDVFQLMDYVNGFGSNTDSMETEKEELENAEDNPFIVPLGVDISLLTKIKKASVGSTLLQDLHGRLTVKDGILVLEEMGFTSEAAKMQLTALYRSPRKNHLYAGIDFHLLDIDIARLIHMFPDIDTIIPMLKSFDGKAEFHFSIETYMKSNYDLKMSTLRGATAIKGQDLILLDNETFKKISKKLLFSKKTANKVDSIAVEATIFRNEIELYPFLFSMDKYQAVLAGKHNLDMSFDYHISIVKTPIPIRLGLNVIRRVDKLKLRLARCKYAKLYRPVKHNVVDSKTLELKKLIYDSLNANVRKQEDKEDEE
ncbi:MAG: hypothetical protein LBI60_05995 [Bacteroidales bacterium]|jgi:hypothetical protein|nr:hypothetical protein [Bacteroidales bacterium]